MLPFASFMEDITHMYIYIHMFEHSVNGGVPTWNDGFPPIKTIHNLAMLYMT